MASSRDDLYDVFFRYALAQLGAKREGGRTLVPSKDAKWPVPARVRRSTENRQRKSLFNLVVARVFRHPPLAGGGGVKHPHSITREPIAAATRAGRQTKPREKTLPMIC